MPGSPAFLLFNPKQAIFATISGLLMSGDGDLALLEHGANLS